MEPILVNRSESSLKRQINFLIRRQFYVRYYGYKKIVFYFLVWNLLILGLSILTDYNRLIILKAVFISLTIIAWAVGVVAILLAAINWQRMISWRNSSIKSFLSNSQDLHLAFDSEKITYVSDKYKAEVNWDYYKYYVENKGTLFLFPEHNLYDAIYFSAADIGEEKLRSMKLIVQSKLLLLDRKNGK